MRTWAVVVTVALLSLTAACGDDADDDAAAAPSVQPTSAASAAATEQDGQDPGAQVLVGTVGEPDAPDAFVITLTDESGEQVTSLPAGDYEIRVEDLSEIHNFHLTGEGVEETTTVPETGEVVWEVTLEAGDYTYVCDPHPNMRGEVTVT